ncbi:MAG: MFS transporter [Muribaculaceae bacterium]|nr:MFS transporter [Muribaculaceae bacterium]
MKQHNYSTPAVFISACAGMAFFGVAMLSLGPILGPLTELVEGANALPSTMSIGIIVGTLLFGPIVDKFGYKWLLIASSILALCGVQGLANFREIGLLHASMFCLGLGGGILNGETNALVSDIYDDDHRGGKLGLLGAFYCIGALLWTLLNYFIAEFIIPLNVISGIMVLFIIYFCAISFPKAKPAESVSLRKSLGLLKYPVLLLFGFILFFQSGFEGASGSFTVSFLGGHAGMAQATATLAMTWFTIGMLAGRIPLGAIMKRLHDLGTLYLYLLTAAVGVGLFAFLSDSVVAVYAAMALIGFGVGATYPVVLNFIGGTFRELSGTAFSIALFIALVGQYIFNYFTGAAFAEGQYMFLPIALGVALVMMMLLVPATLGIAKRMKK